METLRYALKEVTGSSTNGKGRYKAEVVDIVVPTCALRKPHRLAAENILKVPHIKTQEIGGRGFVEYGHIRSDENICFTVYGLRMNLDWEDKGLFLEENKGNTLAKVHITRQNGSFITFYFDSAIPTERIFRVSRQTRLGKDLDQALVCKHMMHKNCRA